MMICGREHRVSIFLLLFALIGRVRAVVPDREDILYRMRRNTRKTMLLGFAAMRELGDGRMGG